MDLRLRNSINRVTVVYHDDEDRQRVRTIYSKNRKSRKGTEPVRSLGRLVRKVVSSYESGLKTYLDRHDESNRDKKDGWLRELSYNVYRATRRGSRKLRRTLGLPSIDLD